MNQPKKFSVLLCAHLEEGLEAQDKVMVVYVRPRELLHQRVQRVLHLCLIVLLDHAWMLVSRSL